MAEPDLREAIAGPARKAGLDIEDGLVEVLLRDLAPVRRDDTDPAAHEAGALPLLSHALRATWERSTRSRMTVADYRATGGVRGAVAVTADTVFEALSEAEQAMARRLFVRLVRVSDDAPNTRRRLSRDDLHRLSGSGQTASTLSSVLNQFVAQRLITVDAETVQITHESLVVAWPRLVEWVAADRRRLLIGQQLEDAARQWHRSGRDPALLHQSSRLAAARDWAQTAEVDGIVREFLDASGRRERRRLHLLYQTIATLGVLLLAAVTGGGYAFQQRAEAISQRAAVAEERNLAWSRMVAVRADRLRESDPGLAAQLAVAAAEIAPTVEARSSLLSASASPTVTRILGPAAIIQELAFHPDRALLASASDDSSGVWLWDVADRHQPALLTTELPGLAGVVNAVSFSPDGQLLAAAGTEQTAYLYHLGDPAAPADLGVRLSGPAEVINTVAFSPDGKTLAMGGMDASVYLWDVSAPGSPRLWGEPFAAAEAGVTEVAFSPDGGMIAVASHQGAVTRWDVTEPSEPRPAGASLTGPQRVSYALSFAATGEVLAAASADGSVYLWDPTATSSEPIEVLTPPSGSGWAHSVAFSPDGHVVVAGTGDGQARLWDSNSGQEISALPHPGPVTSLAFEVSGEAIFTAAADGVIRRWVLPGPSLVAAESTVFDLVHHPEDAIVVAASGDGHLYLWDVADRQRPKLLGHPLASPDDSPLVGTVGLSPDGNLLAASARDGTTWRWDITDRRNPRMVDPPLTELPTFAESLVFSPDGTILAAGGTDGTIQLWDVSDARSPSPLATLTEGWGNVYSIAFSPDGKVLAAGAVDRVVWLWDISRPHRPSLLGEPLTGPTNYIYSVGFSPDGGMLVVGSADETVRLWDVREPGRPVAGAILTGPNGYVLWTAFSPDGRKVAGASRDHTVWVWDVDNPAEPRMHAVLTGHAGGVNMLAYHPAGHTLVTSSDDATVKLWRTDPAEVAAEVCATAGDPITASEWEQYLPGLPYQPPC